jgi:hypothetical protein
MHAFAANYSRNLISGTFQTEFTLSVSCTTYKYETYKIFHTKKVYFCSVAEPEPVERQLFAGAET